MESFWSGIQLLRKQYAHRIEAVCRQWDVTRAEVDVLLFLCYYPERNRAADIVELQGLTKSHVSIAAKALCDRGLLSVSNDENDHRVIRLTPTKASEEIIEAASAVQEGYFKELFGCFTPEELRLWRQLQGKLFSQMHTMGDVG